VTWGNGNTGISGTVSDANSLVGSSPNDFVGYFVTPLSNGNYVVGSPLWNSFRGAVTWGNGNTGVSGTVSDANSVVGSNHGDLVGAIYRYPTGFGYYEDITFLRDGNYVVGSPTWNGNQGAVTWVSGTSGETVDGHGTVTPQNSIVGNLPYERLSDIIEDPADQTFLAIFDMAGGATVTAGLTNPNQLTYAVAQSQSETLTPDVLTHTLNSGTDVVLQASNDITSTPRLP
jgi:hypothetical protein